MSNFPDFSELGYRVERLLGENHAGGRVTYLATNTTTQMPVVIKQFQFARVEATWSDYDAYQREIHVLQQLNHPSIPRYLDSFETPSGFCLVQEYKLADSLAQMRRWTLEEIKQIAVALLEVLVYLQSAFPPVIHRDIKPENILVDPQGELKVYLVDFGFARMGSTEVAVSSVVKGTLGFMPPEQIFNRQITQASDLYSLGATLICLLTQTKSSEVGNLIDSAYRINVKQLVPSLGSKFIAWLQKMMAPDLKNRFDNAAAALIALQRVDAIGNTQKRGMPLRGTKCSPVVTAVGIAALGFTVFVGITNILSMISSSVNHHAPNRTSEYDSDKKGRYDRDDDDADDTNGAPDSENKPAISAEQARATALAANPGTTAKKVKLDHKRGRLLYKVKLNNGRKVYVDANNGFVVGTKTEDD